MLKSQTALSGAVNARPPFFVVERTQHEKTAPRHDKCFLRDLHQEIDFYDRKLAYLDNFVEFASPEDREEAEKGLRAKRTPLEKAALELAASGVEYDEKDLPRSLRAMNPDLKGTRKDLPLVEQS